MIRLLWLFFVLIFQAFDFAQAGGIWKEEKNTHFILYYKDAPLDFVQKVSYSAEGYYDSITQQLGFMRLDFWTWENRAVIYIYDNAQDYQGSTGQPFWSAGAAMPKKKIIYAFPNNEKFFDEILPHELGHIIFREFVGFENNAIPLWLDEGIASSQMRDYKYSRGYVKQAYRDGKFIDLNSLFRFNPGLNNPEGKIHLFYAESASIIDFLLTRYGRENFVNFCRNLRDNQDFQKALRVAFSIVDINDLEKKWIEYIND